MSDEKDFLDALMRGVKTQRPHPEMCLFMQGVRKCKRILHSCYRGRISVKEAKRRCHNNYLRTGAYMGPVGWADDE